MAGIPAGSWRQGAGETMESAAYWLDSLLDCPFHALTLRKCFPEDFTTVMLVYY